jgi:histidinol dehydrogenase
MCAVPARLAGVNELVIATTPRVAAQKEFRYVCGLFGIRDVYRAGGAAGIAALALGTESLERVDKIVGPGNQWVAAAKQLLFGETGIDMTAGPSEIVVIADDTANVQMVAADLTAQAEHGEDSASICITDSHRFASRLARVLVPDPRTRAVIESNIGIVVTPTLEAGARLATRLAPEHLPLLTENPRAIADLVPDCGSVFLGSEPPVALGDYVAGSNHVLPTGGSARFGSPLGVYDFYKRSNQIAHSTGTRRAIATAGGVIARFEGLPAHARSIEIREEQS